MNTMIQPLKQFHAEQLQVTLYASRSDMGLAAAKQISHYIKEKLSTQETIRIIFAAAPSQNEVLSALAADTSIPWQRVEAFHMDEYINLSSQAPQRFGQFLKERLFNRVPFKAVHYIQSDRDITSECDRYSALIQEAPIDIVCLGIGENGHLAFNDPPVANFDDPSVIKPVELDHACRQQQVNDGCFTSLEEVPTHALTLTIPTLMSADRLFCVVPSATKRDAVRRTLHEELSTACPSTILRTHANCTLYIEPASYGDVDDLR